MLFFKNHTITIYRRRQVSTTNRYTLSATFTAYQTDIQPAGQQRTEFVQGRLGATFVAFVDTSVAVKEGDHIHITGGEYDGKVFAVKGVQHWEGAGLLDHTELTLIAQDA